MERIDYDGITLLARDPKDWVKETITINLGNISYNGSSKKERAEIISLVAYPEVHKASDLDDLMVNGSVNFVDLKEESIMIPPLYRGIMLLSKGLMSGTPFASKLKSLDSVIASNGKVITGAELAGEVDLRYMLFGDDNNSWLRDFWNDRTARRRYINFLDILNRKVLDGSLSPSDYAETIDRIQLIYHKFRSDLLKVSFGYKQRATNMHRKILKEDSLILKHIIELKS